MKATQYAKALYEMGERATVRGLREALALRGHTALMPQIYAEYQRLALAKKRLATHKRTSPARERTRVLLELYRTLTK